MNANRKLSPVHAALHPGAAVNAESLFGQATFFVFSAAATRAWIVTAGFGLCPFSGDLLRHPLPFAALPLPESSQLFYKRPAVGKEAFIAITKVVQSGFAIRRVKDAIFRAPPIAHIQDLAPLTIAG